MEQFSIWHWIVALLYVALILVPIMAVMRKAGYSRTWAIVFLIPLVNLIALWIFAFSNWPALKR